MADPRTLRYESPVPGVARIVLDRPEARNAQDKRMTYELNDAFDRAAQDDDVKVVVLAGDGPHFCAGHDLRDRVRLDEFETVSTWSGFRRPGAEGLMAAEEEMYLQMCWRWRNLPKPTIASVHGKTIAGGLMLVWVCDLVIAADDATFSDPTVAMGVNGIELFAHPWELGARKAKQLLFTGDEFGAEPIAIENGSSVELADITEATGTGEHHHDIVANQLQQIGVAGDDNDLVAVVGERA